MTNVSHGIFVEDNSFGTLTVINNRVAHNEFGVEVTEASGATLALTGNVIQGNIGGGGVRITSGTGSRVTLTANIIVENAASLDAPGLYLVNGGPTSVTHNIVSDNDGSTNPVSAAGGVSLSLGASTPTTNVFSDNLVNRNVAGSSGAMYLAASAPAALDVQRNTVVANQNTRPNSAAITVNGAGAVTLAGNNIFGNTAAYVLEPIGGASAPTVEAANNWWGTADPAVISALVLDSSDDATLGTVNVAPAFTAIDVTPPISPPAGLTVVPTDVGTVTLHWNANPESDTTGYRVWYGSTDGVPGVGANQGPSPIEVGNITSFVLTGLTGTLAFSVTAYDAARDGVADQTDGNESWYAATVVSATAPPPRPGVPSNPTPTDGAAAVDTATTLGWTPATDTITYDVAFGTTNPPPIVSTNITATSWAPAAHLAASTTYYWQITARNDVGTTAGPVWSFSTADPPPPPPDPDGGPNCAISVSGPSTLAASSAGAQGLIAVATSAGCAWRAASSVPWLTVAASGTPYAYPSLVLADHPLAYYRFGDTNDMGNDLSGFGFDGNIPGGVTLGARGVTADGDLAATFVGSTARFETRYAQLLPAGGVTLEGWVWPNVVAQTQPYLMIGGAGDPNYGYLMSMGNDRRVYATISTSRSTVTPLISSTMLANNQWYHIALTWDGATERLFVNGALEASRTLSGAIDYTGISWFRLAQANTLIQSGSWQGRLDEFALYDHALSAQAIAYRYALGTAVTGGGSVAYTVVPYTYTAGSAAPAPRVGTMTIAGQAITVTQPAQVSAYSVRVVSDNPAGYWRLDETSDPIAYDSSGHGAEGRYGGTHTLGVPGVLADGNTGAGLDGNSGFVDVYPVPTTLRLHGAQSFEAWVRATVQPTGEPQIVGNFHNMGVGRSGLTLRSDRRVYFYIGYDGNAQDSLSANFPFDGAWHHVVGTWNGTTDAGGQMLYLDGAVVAQRATKAAEAPSDWLVVRIGRNGASYFNGDVDEVAIYDYALTGAQIRNHAAAAVWVGPTITSLAPASAVAGSGATQLTVTGNGFTSGSVVQVNGSNRATTFVSATSLTATTLAGDVASVGTLSITVSGSPAASFAVTAAPTPPIGDYSSLIQSDRPAAYWRLDEATGALAHDLSGHLFHASHVGTVLRTSGALLDGDGAIQLDERGYLEVYPVPAALKMTGPQTFEAFVRTTATPPAGSEPQIVGNFHNLGLGRSGLTLKSDGRVYFYIGNDGVAAHALSAPFHSDGAWHHVVGTWDGSSQTLYLDGIVAAQRTTTAGEVPSDWIVVRMGRNGLSYLNGSVDEVAIYDYALTPAQVLSHTMGAFWTDATTPSVINGISPAAVDPGGGDFTLTVTGVGFGPGSFVQLNGEPRATTYVSPVTLTATILAADIVTAGSRTIRVSGSAGFPLTVGVLSNPVPKTTAVTPSPLVVGPWSPTITVSGSNFVAGAIVMINAVDRATTYVSATTLTATLLPSDVASARTMTVKVLNPEPGGGWSNGVLLTTRNATLTVPVSQVPPDTTVPVTLTAGAGGATDWLALAATGAPDTSFLAKVYVGAGITGTTWAPTLPSIDGDYEFRLFINDTFTRVATSPKITVSSGSPPAIATISPSSVAEGSGDFVLTVSGFGFTPASVVQVNASARATTYVSSTTVTAIVLASDVAQFGSRTVRVSGSAGAALTVTAVVNPAPHLTSISPSAIGPGAWTTTLTVTGSNFVQGAVVTLNADPRQTAYVSSTTLTATLVPSDLATARTWTVKVLNPAPGGGWSSGAALKIVPPSLTVPVVQAPFGTAIPVTLTGGMGGPTDWLALADASAPDSSYFDRVYVGAGVTTLTWSASMPYTAGTYQFRLFANDGFTRLATSPSIVVNAAATPTISGLSPSTVNAGNGDFTLTVTGLGFTNASTVQVNGLNRPTTYISSTSVSAAIPASDVAQYGFLTIRVSGSAGVELPVTTTLNPRATMTSFSPTKLAVNSAMLTLTVVGSGFIDTSTVMLNGVPRQTTFVSPTTLTATLVPSDVAVARQWTVKVANPDPGANISSGISLTVMMPTLTPSLTQAAYGTVVPVTVVAAPGGANDWLTLAATGAPENSYIDRLDLTPGVTNLTWNPTMPAVTGTYQVRLFVNGGATRIATSAPITVTPPPIP